MSSFFFLYCHFLLQAFGCTKNSTHCSMIASTVRTRGPRLSLLCYLLSALTAEDRRHNQAADGSAEAAEEDLISATLNPPPHPQKGFRGWVLLFYRDVYDVIFSVLSVGISCSQDCLPINDWFTSFCLLAFPLQCTYFYSPTQGGQLHHLWETSLAMKM